MDWRAGRLDPRHDPGTKPQSFVVISERYDDYFEDLLNWKKRHLTPMRRRAKKRHRPCPIPWARMSCCGCLATSRASFFGLCPPEPAPMIAVSFRGQRELPGRAVTQYPGQVVARQRELGLVGM